VPPGNLDDLAASGQRPPGGRDLPVFPAAGSQSVDVGLASPRLYLAKAARISSFSTADSASLIPLSLYFRENSPVSPKNGVCFFALLNKGGRARCWPAPILDMVFGQW